MNEDLKLTEVSPVVNQQQLARKTMDIIARRQRLPLEVILDALDAAYEAKQLNAAAALAVQAAPYVHSRLKDVMLTGTGTNGAIELDARRLRNLTPQELQQLETLMLKVAQDDDGESLEAE